MGLAVLGTLIFLFLLGIVITAVILGILNSITDNLNETNYKTKTGDCASIKDKIDGVLDTISTFRLINGLLLGLFILLFLLMIVAAVFYFKSGKKSENKGNFLSNIILNRWTFIIIMVIFLVLFLTYTIVYGTIFGNLNGIDKKCFQGDENIPDTEKYVFSNALSQARIQFFTCLFMLIIVIVAIGIGIFVIFKSKKKTEEVKQLGKDITSGVNEGYENVKENFRKKNGGIGDDDGKTLVKNKKGEIIDLP
jgi:uncharacterized protein (UPF0333 family)